MVTGGAGALISTDRTGFGGGNDDIIIGNINKGQLVTIAGTRNPDPNVTQSPLLLYPWVQLRVAAAGLWLWA